MVFHLSMLLMLTCNIILAISRHDSLKPLGISFRPHPNNLHDTKYLKQCTSINKPGVPSNPNTSIPMTNNITFISKVAYLKTRVTTPLYCSPSFILSKYVLEYVA